MVFKRGVAWLGNVLMSCIPESWEHSVETLRGVWVWSCRKGVGDKESEGDDEIEGDGEREGD